MYMWHKISAILPSTYQTLLKLIEIRRSSDRNKFAQFFLRHRVYTLCPIKKTHQKPLQKSSIKLNQLQ